LPRSGEVSMNDSEKTGTAAETRILVVDDDRNAAMYIADLLKTSDYAVSVCHSGAEALDFVQKNPWIWCFSIS